MANLKWSTTGYGGLLDKKGRFNGYSYSGKSRRARIRPGLLGQLDRQAMKLSGELDDLKQICNYEWDEIMRKTATRAPVPPRNTYGVDTRGGRDIVTFKIWWDDFKGSERAAQRRFELRRQMFEDFFRQRVSDMRVKLI